MQLSDFYKPRHRYLCFGFARPLALAPNVTSSAIIGFQVDEQAQETIHFLNDPQIPKSVINETCERCPLSRAECAARAALPTVYEAKRQQMVRQAKVAELLQGVR